jgi:antitoxin PrlF
MFATITSKGQITIPVEIRKALKLNMGDRIAFDELQPGTFAFTPVKTHSADALKGMFGPAKKIVSIEAMNAAIAARGALAK